MFRGRQGGPLRASTLQRWLNHWLTEAGLRDETGNRYTLHSLRQFAAERALRQIDVIEREVDQLLTPQAGVDQQRQRCSIPRREPFAFHGQQEFTQEFRGDGLDGGLDILAFEEAQELDEI